MTARVALPDDMLDDAVGWRRAAFLRAVSEAAENFDIDGLVAVILERTGLEVSGHVMNTATGPVAGLARLLAEQIENYLAAGARLDA